MAKRRDSGGGELNLDSLMDAVTNVVGVLMIVFVVMALNTARTVQKILSDLPPITPEQHREMLEKVKKLPPPPADPKELEEKKKLAEQQMKRTEEDLKTIDTSDLESKMKFMDLDSFRKQLDDAKKKRETEKAEVDKLLTEVERLKALLDQTPVYQPPPPTYVRLPNPRPYPAKPNETRVLVAKQGVLVLNEKEFLTPIMDGLDKVKSQLGYKDVKIEPFAKLLEKVLGNAAAAKKAWPEIAPFAANTQLEPVAQAYRVLAEGNLNPNKNMLEALADVSLAIRAPLPAVAEAVVAATKGDVSKWVALDPSKDPLKPTLKATPGGGKITFAYGSKTAEVKSNPRDVLNYFVKDLGDMDGIKNRSRDRIVYDAFKVQQMLERAAQNPTFTGPFLMKPTIRPGSTTLQLALTPKPGGGETLDQMRGEGSNYQRLLRQIKADPNGVVVYQVMADAFDTYLEARKIADQIGVAATWEFLGKLDVALNVAGFEVQKFTPTPPAPPPSTVPGVRIAAPKRSLD